MCEYTGQVNPNKFMHSVFLNNFYINFLFASSMQLVPIKFMFVLSVEKCLEGNYVL